MSAICDYENANVLLMAGTCSIALAKGEKGNIITDATGRIVITPDFESAEEVAKAGADIVATTLNGYLPESPYPHDEKYIPNLYLLKNILQSPKITCPVIGEGRFWNPKDVKTAFDMGVHAIVIGKAITNPMAATEYFVSHLD